MQLMINDCPVEIDRGGMTRMSDLVDSVTAWSRERNLILAEFTIDDNRYDADRVPDINLEQVKVVNCIVHSKADVVFSTAEEGARYCERAVHFLRSIEENPSTDVAGDLAAGLSWLGEVLTRILNLLGVNPSTAKYRDRSIAAHLEECEHLRSACVSASPKETRDLLPKAIDLLEDTRGIFRMLLLGDAMRALIIQSIDSPDVLITALAQVKDEIPAQIENIREAAAAYQAGKDREAAERLKGFVDFVYRYIRTSGQVEPVFRVETAGVMVEGVSMDEKNREIRALLHELTSVMENNDIISVSDILEFELVPALSNLASFIEALQEAIGIYRK